MSFFFVKEFSVHHFFFPPLALALVGAFYVRTFYPSKIHIRFLFFAFALALACSFALCASAGVRGYRK